MFVKDVMTPTPASCGPDTNAGTAAQIMWNRNCGLLPIVNTEDKVTGVITDRDLCIALATRDIRPGDLNVREVTTGKVFFCYPGDEIHAALATMGREKVRRLVVLDGEGRLQGVLSIDDIVRYATERQIGKLAELSYADVISTLQHVFEMQAPRVAAHRAA